MKEWTCCVCGKDGPVMVAKRGEPTRYYCYDHEGQGKPDAR